MRWITRHAILTIGGSGFGLLVVSLLALYVEPTDLLFDWFRAGGVYLVATGTWYFVASVGAYPPRVDPLNEVNPLVWVLGPPLPLILWMGYGGALVLKKVWHTMATAQTLIVVGVVLGIIGMIVGIYGWRFCTRGRC